MANAKALPDSRQRDDLAQVDSETSGLLSIFEEQRDRLLRYLRAHGAGDQAEDLLQEIWIRAGTRNEGPIGSPVNYLFRMATNLIIDVRRAEMQARRRDQDWADSADRISGAADAEPPADQRLASRQALALVRARLAKLPDRARRIFVRHRIDGLTQREIIEETGLSRSTIESDLRSVYRLLDQVRREIDEE